MLQRGILLALALVFAVRAEEQQTPAWQRLMQRGLAAYEQHRFQEAFESFTAAATAPGFAAAPSEARHAILRDAGAAAFELHDWPRALEYLRRAAALPERSGDDLAAIWGATSNAGDKRGSVLALTALLRNSPSSLREEDEGGVLQTFVKSRELAPGDRARFDLLDAAYSAGWRNNLGEAPGPAWIDLAGMLLQRGEAAEAGRVIDELDRPAHLIDVRADKRFAAVVDAQPARYDMVAAAHRRVDRLRALLAKKPRSLEVAISLAEAHKDAGESEAALAVLDRALVRAGSFEDEARMINWAHDERSRVLWRLNRHDEAIVELRRGVAVASSHDISQRVNLAEHYILLNQPELALKTLDHLSETATAYGRMAWEYQRLTAADELGDDTIEREALDYLRAHEPDSPHTVRDALVILGNLDEAARVLMGELDDPMFRTEALHSMQRFSSGSKTLQPPRWEASWKQLRERPDVKAAVARAGRVFDYDLPPQ